MRRAAAALAVILGVAGCRTADDVPSPAGLASADSLAQFPSVAVDSAGVAFVAWTAASAGVTDVYLTRVTDENAGAPVRVNDRPGDAATHGQAPAQVALGPDGSVYVAWITQRDVPGRRFPATDLRLARSDDGGASFSPAVTVNDDGGFRSGHHFHDVAVAPDGAVYVSWLDSRVKDAARAGQPAASHDYHDDHGDHGHGAADEPGTEVRVARSDDGGRTFGPSTVVASGSCECCRTRLAFGPDGAVFVAWRHQFEADVRDPAVARSDDRGRTFGAPVRVHHDGWRISGCPHSGPAIAVDAAGDVHLAWYTGAEGRAGLYHAVSRDGGATFAAPEQVAPGAAGAAPAIAADGAAGAWLAWEDRTAHVIRVMRAGGEAATMTLAGESPALAASSAPVLARLDGGRVVVEDLRGSDS